MKKGSCLRLGGSIEVGTQKGTKTRGINLEKKAQRRGALDEERGSIKKGRLNQDGKLDQERNSLKPRSSVKRALSQEGCLIDTAIETTECLIETGWLN